MRERTRSVSKALSQDLDENGVVAEINGHPVTHDRVRNRVTALR